MSGRGPDPKDLRASLVDSGWSATPPPADAADLPRWAPPPAAQQPASPRLPNYEDAAPVPTVTQVDAELQARLHDLQRANAGEAQRAAPLPSFGSQPAGERLPRYPTPGSPEWDRSEATEVFERGSVLPPSDPPELKPLFAPGSSSLAPPRAPSPLAALAQRVRFAGGEVPLWSLLSPMVVLLALGSAFVAAALGAAQPPSAGPQPALSASSAGLAAKTSPVGTGSSAELSGAEAPALPASSIDTEALEARHAEELSKDEALALASARRQHEAARGAALRQKLARDPGLFKDPATLAELRRAAEDPLTAPDALAAMAEAPGPLGADLLYEMWTGTVVRNGATELARSLVFSKEVRAAASPALGVALDLRTAQSCEQNRELLPRVTEHGDRRSLALLAKLSRKFGCGPTKRADCYPCLRDDKSVDDAMAAVKKRREPRPFSGK